MFRDRIHGLSRGQNATHAPDRIKTSGGGGSKLVTSAQLPGLVKILAAAGVSTLAQKHTQFGLV